MKQTYKSMLYTYCIPFDDGAAPNPFWGICTLVICKPKIRLATKIGDWVVGLGSKNSPIGNISKHVVYMMKVTDKITMEEYDRFCRNKFPNKIPDWHHKDIKRRLGDCLYDFSDNQIRMRKGVHNEFNRDKDLSGKYALISEHFYYFGDSPVMLPESLFTIAIERQGHKSKSNTAYFNSFVSWIESMGLKPNKLYGRPQLELFDETDDAFGYSKKSEKCCNVKGLNRLVPGKCD